MKTSETEPYTGDDLVLLMVDVAFRAHQRGDITKGALCEVLERAINCRAVENGYADVYGLPCRTSWPRANTRPARE